MSSTDSVSATPFPGVCVLGQPEGWVGTYEGPPYPDVLCPSDKGPAEGKWCIRGWRAQGKKWSSLPPSFEGRSGSCRI